MTTPFSVRIDGVERTLDARLDGMWDVDIAKAYLAELTRAGDAFRRSPGPSWWLIDLSTFGVQTRSVADCLMAALPGAIPGDAVVARVSTTALSAIQGRRVAPDAAHENFGTIAEARAWLTSRRTASR